MRSGNVLGVFAAARDVTAAEAGLAVRTKPDRGLLDPLVTISADGKITDVNEAAVKVTGVIARAADRDRLLRLFHRAQKGARRLPAGLRKGFVTDYPLTIRHRDGQLTDVLYNASVYNDAAATCSACSRRRAT